MWSYRLPKFETLPLSEKKLIFAILFIISYEKKYLRLIFLIAISKF